MHPKQFVPLIEEDPLPANFKQNGFTAKICARFEYRSAIIVAGEERRFLAAEQISASEFDIDSIILEPEGRNTAPALTLAALQAAESDEDAILIALPADHFVADLEKLAVSIQMATQEASEGHLVVLGIKPDSPHTGYGYIKTGGNLENTGSHEVLGFIEKPDSDTAKKLVDEGNHFWNAGVFVTRASVWLKAIKVLNTEIWECTVSSWLHKQDDSPFSA